MGSTITLSTVEQVELTRRAASQAGRADEARRARLILLLDEGHTWAAIRGKLDCTDSFIDRWSKRFVAERLAGLFSRHAGQLSTTLTPALEARILEWSVKRKPLDGSIHWRSPGKTATRHTSAEFVAFLTDIVANQPRGKEIHVIADNLSAHKSQPVRDFLAAHQTVHLHFTPTYSSWLNQVELWFAKIEREVIARGEVISVPDLKRKLMRYIRHCNKAPKPVKWKYFDPTRHITSRSAVTGH